ncbi:hypothetical protein POM88_048965 [Heracleum sosnowskyi]|uniref:Helitron helicase-like domain-containing protein n=1 Tax=Heracleum sosnowskyi TaxID=360622 RepID=A0AAD8GWZ4_9APIA|nr:hypothetical protein POM88_048965 [Heracleum sosnowskyi]
MKGVRFTGHYLLLLQLNYDHLKLDNFFSFRSDLATNRKKIRKLTEENKENDGSFNGLPNLFSGRGKVDSSRLGTAPVNTATVVTENSGNVPLTKQPNNQLNAKQGLFFQRSAIMSTTNNDDRSNFMQTQHSTFDHLDQSSNSIPLSDITRKTSNQPQNTRKGVLNIIALSNITNQSRTTSQVSPTKTTKTCKQPKKAERIKPGSKPDQFLTITTDINTQPSKSGFVDGSGERIPLSNLTNENDAQVFTRERCKPAENPRKVVASKMQRRITPTMDSITKELSFEDDLIHNDYDSAEFSTISDLQADEGDMFWDDVERLDAEENETEHNAVPEGYASLDGYHDEIPYVDSNTQSKKKRKRITMKEYYSYKLQVRKDEGLHVRLAGRLYQQYVVDAFSCIEQARLWWLRTHQTELRSDFYSTVAKKYVTGESETSNVGKDDIKKKNYFGTCLGVMYVVEFQKRAVKSLMIHGPCGLQNTKSPCMDKFKCTKHFPKKYCSETYFDQSGSLKYLFKYCLKGHDRATVEITSHKQKKAVEDEEAVDEINAYFDGRYICASEASYRIFGFPIHHRSISVLRLSFHLPGEKSCTFTENETLEKVVRREKFKHSQLESFFILNRSDPNARQYTYDQIPQHYVWNETDRIWTMRKKVSDLKTLWERHWKHMIDDLLLEKTKAVVNKMTSYSDKQLQYFALAEIDKILKSIGKSLMQFK